MDKQAIARHFRILGLEPGATLADVKEAYRFLVQTFHEDKYPADHPFRDKAKNKMVELNESYSQLKTFFQEHPTGEPPGGWAGAQGQDDHRGDDDAMDWKSWQYDQEQSWDSELREWHQSEQRRREAQKSEHEKARRKTIVKSIKVGLLAATFYLFAGHAAGHATHQAASTFNRETIEAKRRYELETNGTANGPYCLSRKEILERNNPLIKQQLDEDREENIHNAMSLVMLLGWAWMVAWIFRSRRAAEFEQAFVDGGKTEAAGSV
jgi:hypothetical protein